MPTQEQDGGLLAPFKDGYQVKIYSRHEDGKPLHQYPSDNAITTVVLKSINICRAMLNTPEVRKGFIDQADKYGSKAWFQRGRKDKQTALEEVVDKFIKEMHTNFPGIFLDHAWNNPGSFGCHYRYTYEGEFVGSDQYICLNGQVS